MNVLTVGLVSIALYLLVMGLWLWHDRNHEEYAMEAEGKRS